MKKLNFTLSRKNQKGQVAIFVALIFQVIFVFFALLVNVGLLVHHKINLQQSTDLAAYYGAMKQAESLNAMAHVNFQIRQAWKLLTWRYRVLGTFGNQASLGSNKPMLPIILASNGDSKIANLALFDQTKCSPGLENTAETPFFCIGHTGFKGWSVAENECKIDCNLMTNAFFSVGGVQIQPVTSETGRAVVTALQQANTQIQNACSAVAGANIKVLAQIILSYQADMIARSKTFKMLAKNLSSDASTLKDLDGKDVKSGSEKTLKNNLTEANLTGLASKINFYNSLSHPDCAVGTPNAASKKLAKNEFVKRIEFEFINFFQHSCIWQPTGTGINNNGISHFNPGSIFNSTVTTLADGSPLKDASGNPVFNGSVALTTPKINNILPAQLEAELMKLISNDDEKFSVGYEKDPWCPAYFVVQASSTPRIPFLPLSEIKLNAVAIAKPFGGSIGPWFGKKWESSNFTSQAGLGVNDESKQTDEMLPTNNMNGAAPINLKGNIRLLPNFSRFVGDTKGLSDPTYLAQYHGALINHEPKNGTSLFGGITAPDPSARSGSLVASSEELSLDSWIESTDMSRPSYDPVVGGMTGHDSFLRALELSALAPNQFDLTYYSIDPDYYNNYYLKLKNNYNKLDPSLADNNFIRPDFGHNPRIYSNEPEFSVRNQIEIVKKTFGNGFDMGIPPVTGPAIKFIDAFPELVKKQSSLLTGWTFANFSDFDSFPGGDMSPTDTMNFGRCKDQWQDNGGQPEYNTPKTFNSALPSTPGNCVTGGRVGYSVKLVSPSSLAGPQSFGGKDAQKGLIRNSIPATYLNFQ